CKPMDAPPITTVWVVRFTVQVDWEEDRDFYREIRFLFAAEEGADVPCHLLIPQRGEGPHPVVICLQGHTSGMHISFGSPKYPGDEDSIAGGRDFALQAVKQGYAALALEQRCFGERRDQRKGATKQFSCHHGSLTALLLGRTMVGERVWDVSRAIDALAEFPQVDRERIGCMGNSGGGTITFYAACVDERIKIAMSSCSFCTYRHGRCAVDHCICGYLPGVLKYFEMGDLAGLIAPRAFIVVAGEKDHLSPIAGVREAFAAAEALYKAAGAEDKIKLVIGSGGHRFYPQEAWPVFRQLSGWR
ncbi:MAG TPA: alpha/beta hydrolase family protein, partial [Bacillota bacterium]|nr:alpha/beta hydrolase family protein [Bacillota bacterium]